MFDGTLGPEPTVPLSPPEIEALEQKCSGRLMGLLQEGQIIAGVESRLLSNLICELLTPEQAARAKTEWLYWLEEKIEMGEAEVRRRLLAMGGGGLGGIPR